MRVAAGRSDVCVCVYEHSTYLVRNFRLVKKTVGESFPTEGPAGIVDGMSLSFHRETRPRKDELPLGVLTDVSSLVSNIYSLYLSCLSSIECSRCLFGSVYLVFRDLFTLVPNSE